MLFYCFAQLGHNNTPAVFHLHIISFLHLQTSLRHYTICSANIARGYSKIMILKFQARTFSPLLNSEIFMVMSCKTPTQLHKVKKKITIFTVATPSLVKGEQQTGPVHTGPLVLGKDTRSRCISEMQQFSIRQNEGRIYWNLFTADKNSKPIDR